MHNKDDFKLWRVEDLKQHYADLDSIYWKYSDTRRIEIDRDMRFIREVVYEKESGTKLPKQS